MTKDLSLEGIEVEEKKSDGVIKVKYQIRDKISKQKSINEIIYTKEQIVMIEKGLEKSGIEVKTKTSGWANFAVRSWNLLHRFWNWLWPIAVRGAQALRDTCWGNNWLARAIGVNSCWDFGNAITCAVYRFWWC